MRIAMNVRFKENPDMGDKRKITVKPKRSDS